MAEIMSPLLRIFPFYCVFLFSICLFIVLFDNDLQKQRQPIMSSLPEGRREKGAAGLKLAIDQDKQQF